MEQFRALWGLVQLQLLHSLHEILHSPVHLCPGGATAHAQPQRILRHLWGNPAAQQHWGGPATQPGGGGWTGRLRKPHTSAGSLTEPQEQSHLQIHSRYLSPAQPRLLSKGTQSHQACCPKGDLALLRRACSMSLWVGSSATSRGHCSRPGQKHPQSPDPLKEPSGDPSRAGVGEPGAQRHKAGSLLVVPGVQKYFQAQLDNKSWEGQTPSKQHSSCISCKNPLHSPSAPLEGGALYPLYSR